MPLSKILKQDALINQAWKKAKSEVSINAMKTLHISTDDEFLRVRAYYYQFKAQPKLASSQDISDLIKILEKRNLRFPSDKFKRAEVFGEYLKELPKKVYYDALAFILEHLTVDNTIIDHSFFPTMKEIIKIQDVFVQSFNRIKPILHQSLKEYFENIPYADYEKLAVKIEEQNKELNIETTPIT